tara:strand:- start:3922 stop:9069 length:5148 start_codon:yes stop_codon:yes gene_type:complete
MAARYFKKGPTPDFTSSVSATYPDLYDNNVSTADIQSGTVGDVTDAKLFISDYKLPATPSYGSAELVGAKIGLYINSVSGGTNQASVLKTYKLLNQIGNNEGGKASAVGSLVANKDIVQISAFHSDDYPYIHEDFTGATVEGHSIALGYSFPSAKNGDPMGFFYLEKQAGYDLGNDYGGEKLLLVPYTEDDHFAMFGQTHPILGEIYILAENKKEVFMTSKKKWTAQDGYEYCEKYSGVSQILGIEVNSGGIFPHLKYFVPRESELTSLMDITRDKITTNNTIFTIIKEDESFSEVNSDGESVEVAYSYIAKSDNTLKGNNSLHFESLYPHRFNTTAQVYYGKRFESGGTTLQDGSENQQVSLVSTVLPKPVHLYTINPDPAGVGMQPVTPVVELDFNIEELAPMLVRDQNASYAEPAHDYRLTRSISITFGEEPARSTDNLYTYLKRHAPNASDPGTGSGTGLGTSAKSFFGISFVKHDGQIGYYNLGNAGKSGSVYSDSTFILDNSRGEVCFAAAPTTSFDSESLMNTWFTLAVQLHPDDQGAVWCAYDPEQGDILTENTPSSTQKLTNLKNITDSGAGVWANNNDNFPKYMTVWNQNYQAVKGKYNTSAEMYETGLRAANSGSSDTTLAVYGVHESTNANDQIANASGDRFASYLLLDRGDDITLATSDGSSPSDPETITENLNAMSSASAAGTLTITTGSWSEGDYVYYTPGTQQTDGQITQDNFDCKNSFYIDEIRIKHFSTIKTNATPSGSSTIGRLEIPAAVKMPNTAWQKDSANVTNVKTNLTNQPSYLCFGFEDLTDITGPQGLGSFTNATCDTNHSSNTTTVTHDADSRIVAGLQVSGTGIAAGAFIVSITDSTHFVMSIAATATNNNQTLTFDAVKFIHMNGYQSQKVSLSDNIVTNDNSDISNIRVGYSSSIEKYGRQNAANSTAGSVPDTGSALSPVFSNNNTNPTTALRGLVTGDLDTAANEFSVEANGSGNDGVGNVDYFSQKGLMKFRFGYRKSASITVLDNAGNAVMEAEHTEVKVTNGSALSVKDYIMIGSEIILIDAIADDDGDGAFTKATLTVRRARHGTTAAEHADAADVYIVAMPEKRECIFASSRILRVYNTNSILVDDPSIFRNKKSEEYIIYKYDDSHSAPSGTNVSNNEYIKVKVKTISTDGVITFDRDHGLFPGKAANRTDYLISPCRYWLIVEILNIGGVHGWQDVSANTKFLPARSYKNAVQLFEKGTYGVTYNETLFSDAGDYPNKWHLQTYDNTNNGVASLKDYGFGAFDEELQTGGHCGSLAMNIAEVTSTYQFIDLANLVVVDNHKGSDTIPILLTTQTPMDDFKINIDTEVGTNPTYLMAEYEDKLPLINNFNAKPNDDNAFNIDYTWDCADTDLWYGFIMVSPDEVNTQYSGAVLHYPMNETHTSGGVLVTDGLKATAPIDNIQNMTTAVDSGSDKGPFYDIEGLAGNCLRFDTHGTPSIDIGTGSADPLGSTGYTVTDEMSINMHIIPDADVDGTLSQNNCLIGSSQRIFVKLLTNRTIFVQMYWDANSAINLYSSSQVVCDGETPTNIFITFDSNLTSGNVKLFVNGKLEDQTGECITADATGVSQTSWLFKADINSNNSKIFLGNTSDSGSQEFSGRMEEVLFYNRCLYCINPNDKSYTFTKPLKELSETSSKTGSKSYSSKLFIKDYHNIRGTTTDEVASSSAISFKKAAFRLDNS